MELAHLAEQLSDLGGFALFFLFVIVAAIGLHRRWWVPGWIYTMAIARADKSEALTETLVKSMDELTATVKASIRDDARSAGR
jgi:hypothetical protein